jgi:hypothetical protein
MRSKVIFGRKFGDFSQIVKSPHSLANIDNSEYSVHGLAQIEECVARYLS